MTGDAISAVRRVRFAAALLPLTAGCSPADEPPAKQSAAEAEEVTPRAREEDIREHLQRLTADEIWRLGVERFGWYGEEPRASKRELIRYFLIDERFEDFVDPTYDDWSE